MKLFVSGLYPSFWACHAVTTGVGVAALLTHIGNPLGAVPRRKVHRNLVSWNRGILYDKCSKSVLALVGKWICVLSLNIALF